MEDFGIVDRKTPGKEFFSNDWADISNNWRCLNTRYVKFFTNDCAYRYNERTNVGVFSAAAHDAGFLLLQEYKWEKIDEDKNQYDGRVDLWMERSSS